MGVVGNDEPGTTPVRHGEAWRVPRKTWPVRRREWGIWWRRSRTKLTTVALVVALTALVGVAVVRGSRTAPGEPERAPATVTGLSAARPSEAAASRAERAGRTDEPVRFGVFSGTDVAGTRKFEKWAGHKITYAVDFGPRQTWGDIADPRGVLDEWGDTKYTLVLAVPMLPATLNPDNAMKLKNRLMRAGGHGAYDEYFVTLAENLVESGQEKAVLRVGWEFNLRSWAWGTDKEKLYIAFYRQIVDAMRSVPGQKFEFDWNPNNGFNRIRARSTIRATITSTTSGWTCTTCMAVSTPTRSTATRSARRTGRPGPGTRRSSAAPTD